MTGQQRATAAEPPHDQQVVLSDALADALDSEVVDISSLSGGDVSQAYRLTLADGRTVFAKTHADPPPGFYSTEAAGLRWLAAAHAVRVPAVLAVSDGRVAFLALEWIDGEPQTRSSSDVAFGRALARLHRRGAPCFGREDERTTGSRRLPNAQKETWAEFYATQRLLPLARIAANESALPIESVRRLAELCQRLDQYGASDEPAARLHGDLWAGNRLVDRGGQSWLIDPAAHGGHREFDLAMMRLFGGFNTDCYEAYHDASPLADGWEERIPLHQLAPLVTHAIKFGGSYVRAVERALDQV